MISNYTNNISPILTFSSAQNPHLANKLNKKLEKQSNQNQKL